MAAASVAAHKANITHHYVMSYPPHPARVDDPHYKDFNHFHKEHASDARCDFALHATLDGDVEATRQDAPPHRLIGPGEKRAECDVAHPIELHHNYVEFSLQNGVDFAILEKDFPGISDPDNVGAWVESGANFIWYCCWHHRGQGGAHSAAASDFEAEKYVHGLIS